jgi:hypothetical protein
MPAQRKLTHKIEDWAWNAEKLDALIEKSSNNNECLEWYGVKNKHVNLFPGYRNGFSQMNSANRFIYMTAYNTDISEYSVRMSCANRNCCNWEHMFLEPNRRLGLRGPGRERKKK